MVLKRRTLPWERELDGNPDVTSTLPRGLPWLALLVLADAEAELRTARPITECVTTGVNLAGDNDATVGDCIVVTERVVQQVFPTKAELPLLSHVRRVDLNDTELALGDDDGWMAVVLSNRLPQPGVRYQACLISLEGQYGALPDSAAVAGSFSHTYVYADAALAYDALSAQYSRTLDRSATFTSPPAAHTLAIGAAPAAAVSTVSPAAARASAAVAAPASGARSMTVRDGWSGVGGSGASLAATAAGGAVTHTSALIGNMHRVPMQVIDPGARQLTFPVLAHWQFTCTGSGDFQSLMQALDVGMLGTPPQPAPVPELGEKPPAPPSRPPVEVLDTGHVALSHTSREGETGTVWYRGPLTPRPTSRQAPDQQTGLLPVAHASDQVRRVGPDGRENLGLATAFDIGRLLALAEPSVVAALLAWRKDALERARTAALLAGEPSLGPLTAGAVVTALGARAGRDLLAGLGANRAARLGPLRPLDTPGRPIAGVDDADPVQLLSAGLGVPAEVVKGLLTADPAGPAGGQRHRGQPAQRPGQAGHDDSPGARPAASRHHRSRRRPGDPGAEGRRGARNPGWSSAGGRPAGCAGPAAGPPREREERRALMATQTRAAFLDNPLVMQATLQAVNLHTEEVTTAPAGTILPTTVLEWLARVRLLEGVPFAHLVPDSALLPPESIRFFYLDRDWTDAMVQGALAVSTVTTLDREHLQALYGPIRDELDTQERLQRLRRCGRPGAGAAGTVTGFLLRSRAVSGWPGLHVRGYREQVGAGPREDRRRRPAAAAAAPPGTPRPRRAPGPVRRHPRRRARRGAAAGDPVRRRPRPRRGRHHRRHDPAAGCHHRRTPRPAAPGAAEAVDRGCAVPQRRPRRRARHRAGRQDQGPDRHPHRRARRRGSVQRRVRPRDAPVPVPSGLR